MLGIFLSKSANFTWQINSFHRLVAALFWKWGRILKVFLRRLDSCIQLRYSRSMCSQDEIPFALANKWNEPSIDIFEVCATEKILNQISSKIYLQRVSILTLKIWFGYVILNSSSINSFKVHKNPNMHLKIKASFRVCYKKESIWKIQPMKFVSSYEPAHLR